MNGGDKRMASRVAEVVPMSGALSMQKPKDLIDDRLVGLPAMQAVAGISKPTLLKYLREGKVGFPARRVGGRWWASRREILAWCERQASGPTE